MRSFAKTTTPPEREKELSAICTLCIWRTKLYEQICLEIILARHEHGGGLNLKRDGLDAPRTGSEANPPPTNERGQASSLTARYVHQQMRQETC
jgi:hypothetical protein